jgi:hypothetical protein
MVIGSLLVGKTLKGTQVKLATSTMTCCYCCNEAHDHTHFTWAPYNYSRGSFADEWPALPTLRLEPPPVLLTPTLLLPSASSGSF